VFQAFRELLDEAAIVLEWRYYKDGDWLGKCQHKKKTVLWLSVWEGYLQAGFFFTEATSQDVPERLRHFEKNVGKFVPLVMKISAAEQLDDLALIIAYKKGLK